MPHEPEPWYRGVRGWYVNMDRYEKSLSQLVAAKGFMKRAIRDSNMGPPARRFAFEILTLSFEVLPVKASYAEK